MNTCSGKAKFNNFQILLDSGSSSTIVMGKLTSKFYILFLWGRELTILGFPYIFFCFFLFTIWRQLTHHNSWTTSTVQ